MRYLLDTDHISFIQRRSGVEYTNLSNRISQHSPNDFALSIVSFHEQVIGAHTFINRAQSKTNLMRGYVLLSETLQSFSEAIVLPSDTPAITVFEQLQNQKVSGSTMDLRIASIALSRNLTVLTRNTRDFGKVPGLSIEDWTL
jgi:tRNA(fMet)-specific endonuclease VapC